MVATITGTYNPEVRKVAKELSELPGVLEVYTYTNPPHGRTGGRMAMDLRVAPWFQKSNAEQKGHGDDIVSYIETNHERLGIGYMIWFNRWIEYPGMIAATSGNAWVNYEPFRVKWVGPSADLNTTRHEDHIHIQILTGYRYSPPNGQPPTFGEKSDEEKVRIIDEYFREKNYYPWIEYEPVGATILDVCRNETGSDPLWLSTGCSLVEQESGGKNIFGCDYGAGSLIRG